VWLETRKRVFLELDLLRRLVNEHLELLTLPQDTEPGRTEVIAVSGVLHSFYGGIENVFKRIALDIDGSVPGGSRSHTDLLEGMARPSEKRSAVISDELRERLGDYLYFRHVVRHAYSFDLDWSKMPGLAQGAEETLRLLESELADFFGPEDDEQAEG
jgi:hypothetical protein